MKEQSLAVMTPEELPKAHEPRPSEVARGHELWKRMLEECSPAHREILILKRQGLLLTEIATRTGMHEGSIRRHPLRPGPPARPPAADRGGRSPLRFRAGNESCPRR